jgi:hypothetical protein
MLYVFAHEYIYHSDGSVSDAVPVDLTESENDAILGLMREAGLNEAVNELSMGTEMQSHRI